MQYIKQTRFSHWSGLLLLTISFNVALAGSVTAADRSAPYKVSMQRTSPDKPLRKSTIMARVKDIYKGRILSIMHNPDGGDDCHIVKLMGEDGEFRIIHVACQ